jgi:predicted HTH transcriptional regulator
MALPVNIDDLVNHRKVEWARIEYKEGWNPEKVLHSLCAFANDIDNWGGGLVEGRNTGVPIIVNVMRRNGSPMPVFSSPENRDWLSVTLPINPHFCEMNCEMKNPISQTIAPETSLISQRGPLNNRGENGGKSAIFGHVVEVITAEEELALINSALKSTPLISQIISQRRNAEDIYVRLSNIIQFMRRDSHIGLELLSKQLNVSRRTLQQDVKSLKSAGFVGREGPDCGGSWVVLLDYGRNR